MEKLAHEIIKAYKDVYYAHRCVEADREAKRIAAKWSLAVERAAREKLAAELVSQQEAWAAERATLLRDEEKVEAGLQTT